MQSTSSLLLLLEPVHRKKNKKSIHITIQDKEGKQKQAELNAYVIPSMHVHIPTHTVYAMNVQYNTHGHSKTSL